MIIMMINIIYACKYTYAYDLCIYIYMYIIYIYIYRHISLVLQASMKQTSYQLLLLGLHVFFPVSQRFFRRKQRSLLELQKWPDQITVDHPGFREGTGVLCCLGRRSKRKNHKENTIALLNSYCGLGVCTIWVIWDSDFGP